MTQFDPTIDRILQFIDDLQVDPQAPAPPNLDDYDIALARELVKEFALPARDDPRRARIWKHVLEETIGQRRVQVGPAAATGAPTNVNGRSPQEGTPMNASLAADRIRMPRQHSATGRWLMAGVTAACLIVVVTVFFASNPTAPSPSGDQPGSGAAAPLVAQNHTPTTSVATPLPVMVMTATPIDLSVPSTPNHARRIGIIAGHSGPEEDLGAVCYNENGVAFLTETGVNYTVAFLVLQELRDLGYNVDLLDEWDPRLEGYQADALVSIHSGACSEDYLDREGNPVSGYLVGKAEARPPQGPDALLVECIAAYYGQETQLDRRYDLPLDMVDYHAFREISATTPGAIIEIGFLLGDRELITGRAGLVAGGIVDGILCYLNQVDDPSVVTSTPIPVTVPPVASPFLVASPTIDPVTDPRYLTATEIVRQVTATADAPAMDPRYLTATVIVRGATQAAEDLTQIAPPPPVTIITVTPVPQSSLPTSTPIPTVPPPVTVGVLPTVNVAEEQAGLTVDNFRDIRAQLRFSADSVWAWSPDGQYLAVVIENYGVVVYDRGDLQAPLRLLQGHIGEITGLAFHPAATILASSSRDGTVRLWDPRRTGTVLWVLEICDSCSVDSVSFSPDGAILAVEAEGNVQLWSLPP